MDRNDHNYRIAEQQNGHPSDDDLLLYVDGELRRERAASAQAHLEACWSCRARAEKYEETILSFVNYRETVLKPLDEAPPQGWRNFDRQLSQLVAEGGNTALISRLRNLFAHLLLSIRLRVGDTFGRHKLWRPVAVAAVILVLLAPIAWILIAPRSNVSADEILKEAGLREKAWTYQPNKVLHWVVEVELTNHPTQPDGRYVSHHWQNNYPGQATSLTRKYDQKGTLVWAVWRKPDGSEVVFDHFDGDQVRLNPTRVARQEAMRRILREDADKLEPASRQRLEAWVKENDDRDSDSLSRLFEAEAGYLRRSLRNAKLEVVYTPEAGKTFRIRDEFTDRTREGVAIRGVMEQDIAADSLKRFRLKSIRYLPDGKTAVENARGTLFEETSIADLEAHDLRDVIAGAKRVVQLTPEEYLRRFIHYTRQGKEKMK